MFPTFQSLFRTPFGHSHHRKASTASVNISIPSRSLIDVWLDLALDFLMSEPKPFLLLRVLPPTSPETPPTFPHNVWIWRCSRGCLPRLHHQHLSDIHFRFPLREAAITAWPFRSRWKLLAVFFTAGRRPILIFGFELGFGKLNGLFPLFSAKISSLHSLVPPPWRPAFVLLRKDALIHFMAVRSPLSGVFSVAGFVAWNAGSRMSRALLFEVPSSFPPPGCPNTWYIKDVGEGERGREAGEAIVPHRHTGCQAVLECRSL